MPLYEPKPAPVTPSAPAQSSIASDLDYKIASDRLSQWELSGVGWTHDDCNVDDAHPTASSSSSSAIPKPVTCSASKRADSQEHVIQNLCDRLRDNLVSGEKMSAFLTEPHQQDPKHSLPTAVRSADTISMHSWSLSIQISSAICCRSNRSPPREEAIE